MKQNYTLMGGKAWCCFSVFYSRKAWGSLLTEVVSFYREFQSLFHYFVAYFSEQQGEHIKVTFSFDIENMVEIQERVDTHFLLFLNQNPSVHPKQFPFGEDLWCFYPNNSLVWNQYKIQYPDLDLLLDKQFTLCLSGFLSDTYVGGKKQMEGENFNLLEQIQQKVFTEQNGIRLAKWGCSIECLAQKSLIEMDVDEQLTDVDEFLIALWQEMKVPYMGTFQFLLWVGDYFLFRFYDENSLFRSRTSWMLEQIVLGVERFFCQFEYRVRYVEPLFLFPVDVWRDLGEWLLCVEKVCICESVKNVLAKLYALPEMEFLLHCNFPKNTLRWKYREIIFMDK